MTDNPAATVDTPTVDTTELTTAYTAYSNAYDHLSHLNDKAESDGNYTDADDYRNYTFADTAQAYLGAIERVLTALGIHPAGRTDTQTSPHITALPDRWIEVADPSGHRYRLRLPTADEITAHCQDSDQCRFDLTAHHQH